MAHLRTVRSIWKHMDFILSDILVLEFSYFSAYFLYALNKNTSLELTVLFRRHSVLLFFCVLLSVTIGEPYKNVLKRDRYKEVKCVLRHASRMMIADLLLLFFLHEAGGFSRIIFVSTWMIYTVLELGTRLVIKRIVRRHKTNTVSNKRHFIVFTESEYAQMILDHLMMSPFADYTVSALFLSDCDGSTKEYGKYAVCGGREEMQEYALHHWVDEAVIYLPHDPVTVEEMKTFFRSAGITLHHAIILSQQSLSTSEITVEKIGNLLVATRTSGKKKTVHYVLKKLMDITGGIVGCIITLLIAAVIGPLIYIKSPGPIFFKQERVGRNGKTFTMYKFRSMYPDAEERKAELTAKNKMNGMMFKMDDDPRIIGSEKKDRNGRPCGIGNFIRRTSLDEFPQFFNVLKGDMSLVGTRPPTVDEWQRYQAHHRRRLSIRPGITGLWQVSGRSEITDFEEVVRLDEEYIENWDIMLDLRILLRTVKVVFRKDGSA